MNVDPLGWTALPDFHLRQSREELLTGLPRPVPGPGSEPGLDLIEIWNLLLCTESHNKMW